MIFEEIKKDTSKYTFIIDGNYLAMRIGFAVGLDFRENVPKHSAEYYKSLCSAFSNLINDYKDSISKVMIVIDGKSWRKGVEMIPPVLRKHLPQKELQYKANRNKEESPIDMTVVMTVFRNFAENMETNFNVPLIQSEGAEGDDLLYTTSKKEVECGNKCLLYTSDGDISQLVSDNVFVLKQMPADRPNKIIVSESKRLTLYSNEVKPKEPNPLHMFGGCIGTYDLLLKEFSEEDTLTQNAPMFLALKSISGDTKDNIHPTFLWKKTDSNNQEKEYKPTSMYIKKALSVVGMTENDLTIKHLYDKMFYVPLLNNVLRATPLYPKIVDVMRAYKANLKHILSDDATKTMSPTEMVIMSLCGDGSDIKPSIVVEDWDGTEISISEKIVKDALETKGYKDLDSKTLKSNKFPKPFLLYCISKLPRLRPLDVMVKVYEQNLNMLHLNEKSIPKEVLTKAYECYESKKDIVCDMSVVTDFDKIYVGSTSSSDIFNGLDNDLGQETNITENDKLETPNLGVSSVDDTFGIMSTVFGDDSDFKVDDESNTEDNELFKNGY